MIRRGDANDTAFLRDMLRHAYYWRWEEPELRDLPVSRYVEGWGRPGDRALVLIEGFQPVGAAWYRLFSEAQPGYGFVDEQTPELTIAVVPSRRGRGYGAELLTSLLAQAKEDGYERCEPQRGARQPRARAVPAARLREGRRARRRLDHARDALSPAATAARRGGRRDP